MANVSNKRAWENIFEHYDILTQISKAGYFDITANQIKNVDGKEARLMAKVDFRENLPEIMMKNGLSILAIKNGLYRIAPNNPFLDVPEIKESDIIEIEAPKDILSLDPFNINSESGALDIALLSKICEYVFEEDTDLTIRGRLRGNLDFNIDDINYNVDGVQIEVDGGYEGKKAIHLIEAKIGYRNNISIRQLLYPQLYWQNKIEDKKEVKSYLFYLQGDLFRFIPYIYDGRIGFLNHEEEKVFKFIEPEKKAFDVTEIKVDCSKVNINAPFPQADDLRKVYDMLLVISESEGITKEELRLEFDIVDRQIGYYTNVLRWMKLINIQRGCMSISKKGSDLIAIPSYKARMQEMAKIIFSEPIFNDWLHKKEINRKRFSEYRTSKGTVDRRMQTVKAWIKTFNKIFEE